MYKHVSTQSSKHLALRSVLPFVQSNTKFKLTINQLRRDNIINNGIINSGKKLKSARPGDKITNAK